MTSTVAAITNPIALCAYVISAAFGLLAKKWDSKSDKPRDRQLFYLAAALSVGALFGGLFLAWNQQPKTAPSASGTVMQNSSGDQSPNVNSSGSGAVTVQTGSAPAPPPEKDEKKK